MNVTEIKKLTDADIAKLRENIDDLSEDFFADLFASDEGFELALKILDMEKTGSVYLDKYNNKVRMDGNTQLKRAGTVLDLHDIHVKEIIKCANDFNYFKQYIRTDLNKRFQIRNYQTEYTDALQSDAENIITLFGRQCVDGDTALMLSDDTIITMRDLYDTI